MVIQNDWFVLDMDRYLINRADVQSTCMSLYVITKAELKLGILMESSLSQTLVVMHLTEKGKYPYERQFGWHSQHENACYLLIRARDIFIDFCHGDTYTQTH